MTETMMAAVQAGGRRASLIYLPEILALVSRGDLVLVKTTPQVVIVELPE